MSQESAHSGMKILNGKFADSNYYNVDSFGAVGDGIINDAPAIQRAINAVQSNGVLVFSPGKVYRVPTTIHLNKNNITLWGYGAVIDARELNNLTTSQNAAIRSLNVNEVSIFGLKLKGPDPTGSVQHTPESGGVDLWNSVAIYLSNCNHCMIRDCRFEGFFRGGVYVVGDYNSVLGCHFKKVRYREPTGGCIFISANHHSAVVNNIMEDAWGCGIGLQNSSHITVSNNIITGIDYELEPGGQTMGICAISCNQCSYTGNIVKAVTDEGIVLTTGNSAKGSNYNTIANNVLHNCRLYGVALYATGGTLAEPHMIGYNVISNNVVLADADMFHGLTMEVAYYIKTDGLQDYAKDNLFSGNLAHGNGNQIAKGLSTFGVNITNTHDFNNVFRI